MEQRLYIIMREDLYDNSPGKMMAQAAHAQSDFDAYVDDCCAPQFKQDDELWSNVSKWREDRTFGTTLVLSATLNDMLTTCDNMDHCGLTVDPTYPWRNYYGKLFTSEEVTCMWAFVWKDEEIEYMRQFDLHK
jgi:peptidyl-tRNA hydrolase